MKTYKRKIVDQRFSLHDSKIIKIQKEEDDLVFFFDYGFVDIHENRMVEGRLRIKGYRPDDSSVYIIDYGDNLCGNPGKFTGKKMSLDDFIKNFNENKMTLDVMTEYDAYGTYVLDGFLNMDMQCQEVRLEIFYLMGQVYYEIG